MSMKRRCFVPFLYFELYQSNGSHKKPYSVIICIFSLVFQRILLFIGIQVMYFIKLLQLKQLTILRPRKDEKYFVINTFVIKQPVF